MRGVGKYLKDARVSKNISIAELSDKTRIKKEFLEAIEQQKWEKLPEFAVVTGFVKNYTDAVGLDRNVSVSLLRRDYPPSKQMVNPKPEIKTDFKWSPRLTFLAGVLLIILVISSYLGYSYHQFMQPPKLEVELNENQEIYENDLVVKGNTDPGAVIRVNDLPVTVNDDGVFEVEIEVNEETEKIKIVAFSRSGKEVVIERRINVKIEE